MATLVTGVPSGEAAAAVWPETEAADAYRLPLLPWEDVYLHVKRIDNRRWVRTGDPTLQRVCWQALRGAALGLVLLVLMLLPEVFSRREAHRVVVLEKERQTLAEQRGELELEEAAALSPARLDEWARNLELLDPAPKQLRSLNPAPSQGAAVHAQLP